MRGSFMGVNGGDEHTPCFVHALATLLGCLFHAGQYEEAKEVAEESVIFIRWRMEVGHWNGWYQQQIAGAQLILDRARAALGESDAIVGTGDEVVEWRRRWVDLDEEYVLLSLLCHHSPVASGSGRA